MPLLSTAHASNVCHLAAHGSLEPRCNMSYTQISAGVSGVGCTSVWSCPPISSTSLPQTAAQQQYLEQGEIILSHSRYTDQGRSSDCAMGRISLWLLSHLFATQTTPNSPGNSYTFSITSRHLPVLSLNFYLLLFCVCVCVCLNVNECKYNVPESMYGNKGQLSGVGSPPPPQG